MFEGLQQAGVFFVWGLVVVFWFGFGFFSFLFLCLCFFLSFRWLFNNWSQKCCFCRTVNSNKIGT